jgi:hypothetical protein
MAMYTSLHIEADEPCDIGCSHQLNGLRPEGYPVLAIGTLSIYPTRERLERIRAAIDAYLAAHGDGTDCPRVGETSGIVCDRCGSFTMAFKGHLRCFGCGNSMPLPADPPVVRGIAAAMEATGSDRVVVTRVPAGGKYPAGYSYSAPDEPDAPAESLESMALEELKSDLTEAAHEVGIDPDGLSDGEVIRALVGRAAGVRAESVR